MRFSKYLSEEYVALLKRPGPGGNVATIYKNPSTNELSKLRKEAATTTFRWIVEPKGKIIYVFPYYILHAEARYQIETSEKKKLSNDRIKGVADFWSGKLHVDEEDFMKTYEYILKHSGPNNKFLKSLITTNWNFTVKWFGTDIINYTKEFKEKFF